MEKVKIGMIGLGGRGYGLMCNLLDFPDVEVTGTCDLYEDRAENAAKTVKEKTGVDCVAYTDARDLIAARPDAIMITAAWEAHIPMALLSLRAGIPTAFEVGGAYSLSDCEMLVRTQEETGTPFMFLENCCFNKDELLATAMARDGLFGEIVYCEGQYAHDLREEVAHGKENRHYRLRNYLNRNCENYPTHELLPIMKLLGINRGNRMVSLVSVASKAAGMNEYAKAHPDTVDPALQTAHFAQGDIVDTVITCAGGQTIHLRLDTTLPRFYDRGFTVRGTKGLYIQTFNAALLDSDGHMGYFDPLCSVRELLDNAKKYEEKYLPAVWKNITPEDLEKGHGGMDVIELRYFVDAVKNGTEMPIDVYDAAAVMAVSVCSEESIAHGGAPVAIPDYTHGTWTMRPLKDVMPLA